MDIEQKNQVLEILDYWKTIEFLEQESLPKVSENKNEGSENDNYKEIIKKVSLEIDLQSLIEEDQTSNLPDCSETIGFIFGETKRNDYANKLEEFLNVKSDSPEPLYSDKDAFGWFSFSTDMEGKYKKNTFQLSPLLWALTVWKKNQAEKIFHLDTKEYDEIIKKIDEEIEEKSINEFLLNVYQEVKNTTSVRLNFTKAKVGGHLPDFD